MKAPLGSVVNATEPAGVVGGFEVASRVVGAVFRALSEVMPEKITAACKGHICNIGFGGFDPRKQRHFSFLETVGGGSGGRLGKDGLDAVNTELSNTENAPVEEMEIGYPVRISRYELVPNSAGAGRWRGGLGIRRDYEFPFAPATFCIISDRSKFPPWGIEGGKEAVGSKYIVNPDTPEARAVPSKGTFEVVPGQVVSVRTAGGGGYGDPRQRDPQSVLVDVVRGKISVEQARSDYGVVVTDDEQLDARETERVRRGGE